ncbi:hypothetical protein RhiirB3_457092 [Rhizophagus irregularis]|nr:hypothetical protein RhiirB3_457092 [Rhizophagus irregularis]
MTRIESHLGLDPLPSPNEPELDFMQEDAPITHVLLNIQSSAQSSSPSKKEINDLKNSRVVIESKLDQLTDFKSHSSRLLSVNLYFKGNVKLRIFVIYIPPPAESVLRSDTIELLIQQLSSTKQAGFYHAVCGNFNMHLDKYYSIYFNQPQLLQNIFTAFFFISSLMDMKTVLLLIFLIP